MIQEIGIPSEVNVFPLTAGRLEPFNTYRAPYEFLEEDEKGEETPYNIEAFEFLLTIYKGKREKVEYNDTNFAFEFLLTIYKGKREKVEYNDTNFVKYQNKLWLDIDEIDLDGGVYDYKISIVGGNSIIKGSFKVVSNGK